MAYYTVNVIWDGGDAAFADNRYSRLHRWKFDGGTEVPASASPHIVPVPMADAAAVDPEEAFVAAVSSCHMLWFLSIAVKHGFVVDRYEDEPEGTLEEDERGRRAITRVALRPHIIYAAESPDRKTESSMHEEAHESCFIANSVRTEIVVKMPREV